MEEDHEGDNGDAPAPQATGEASIKPDSSAHSNLQDDATDKTDCAMSPDGDKDMTDATKAASPQTAAEAQPEKTAGDVAKVSPSDLAHAKNIPRF